MLLKEKLANGFLKAENMILKTLIISHVQLVTKAQKQLGEIYMCQQHEHRGCFF